MAKPSPLVASMDGQVHADQLITWDSREAVLLRYLRMGAKEILTSREPDYIHKVATFLLEGVDELAAGDAEENEGHAQVHQAFRRINGMLDGAAA